MDFEVYVLCEKKSGALINVWTGNAFEHPAQFSPYYFNKREIPAAYRLMSNLYMDRLRENESELSLEKFTFTYANPIASAPTPPVETPEEDEDLEAA
ncbi:hypothetical protein [Floridanema evergladense]|uniref:Uncharacterized protein n=1 Tax=Floridaenema evergladense BLCC-F167 TaxID=3153639 RepID=A0ABV4WEH9_9CYAN